MVGCAYRGAGLPVGPDGGAGYHDTNEADQGRRTGQDGNAVDCKPVDCSFGDPDESDANGTLDRTEGRDVEDLPKYDIFDGFEFCVIIG